MQTKISGSPGNYFINLACSNGYPAFSLKLVIAASLLDKITPSQSPAFAMWIEFLRITAVKAHAPTVLYYFLSKFALKIAKNPFSTS